MAKDTPQAPASPAAPAAPVDLNAMMLEFAQMKARLAEVEAAKLKSDQELNQLRTGQPPPPPPQPKYTGTFRVGPSKHYRNGILYGEGALISVKDEEVPSDWVLVPDAGPVAPPSADAPSQKDPPTLRPADSQPAP